MSTNGTDTSSVKLVDALDRDREINGQRFACLSFISPEELIQSREKFFFDKYTQTWGMKQSLLKFTNFMHFLSYKHALSFDDLKNDLDEFVANEKDSVSNDLSIVDDYKNFIDTNEEALTCEFNKMHEFQTSVRGIKVRGTYASLEEAELRCRMIREVDNNFDVYVAEVGAWVPFHPEAYKTGRVEYLEEELNKLMHEKIKNESAAKQAFDQRIKESRRKAIEENIDIASKNNNVLTQTINDSGELVSIKDMNTQENILNSMETVDTDAVKRVLFETDDVPTKNGPRQHLQ